MRRKEFNRLFFRYRLAKLAWFLTNSEFCFTFTTSVEVPFSELLNEKHLDGINWNFFMITKNLNFQRYFPLAKNIYLLSWKNSLDFRFFCSVFLSEHITKGTSHEEFTFLNLLIFKGRFYSLQDFITCAHYFQLSAFYNKPIFAHKEFIEVLNFLVVKHGLLVIFQRLYFLFFKQQFAILHGNI